jgi:peptidoglycan/xylan/chitin deacetylase (PgdA/CDA1 family)
LSIFRKFRKVGSLVFFSRFHRKDFPLHLNEPLISFTFDDVPPSAATMGENILKKFGYCGTYYLAAEYMMSNGFDFEGSGGHLLQEITERGGELACHTYSHLHFLDADRQQIISDLEKNRDFIETRVAGYKVKNFSYPFGEQTLHARAIVKDRFNSARSNYRGINLDKIDLNCLKSVRLYESVPPDEIFRVIDKATRKKGWLIFYTHDVVPEPSVEGCSPGYFEKIVQYCFDRRIRVLPINRALEFIRGDLSGQALQ